MISVFVIIGIKSFFLTYIVHLGVTGIAIIYIMFLKPFNFCRNRDLLNQKLVRHISHTYYGREILNFSLNDRRNLPKAEHYNQSQCKLKFGGTFLTDRNFSTHNSHVIGKPKQIAFKEEREEFMSLFPAMLSDFIKCISINSVYPPELYKHIETVFQYNLPTGKQVRGLELVAAYKMIESPENLNLENIRLANILGWCVEMFQAFIIVSDDVIDQSETRRGTICWYKNKNIGYQAINDAIVIQFGIFPILKKYFANHPRYQNMLDLFHEVTLKTVIGQCLDYLSMSNNNPKLDLFTMNKYKTVMKFKTYYATLYLPVALAMNLSQNDGKELHPQTEAILSELGILYQIQNDYLDCFGNPDNTGKKGNDITEGKCTWLAVVALQKASSEQKEILKEHYGKPNNESEQIVRNLYEELRLPDAYAVYQKECFDQIRTQIQQISTRFPREFFFKLMEMFKSHEC